MAATVQLPADFLADFLDQANAARQRVWLQSMNFEAGQMLDTLQPVLIKKANQKIDVRLEIDWVAQRFVHGHLPLIPVLNAEKRRYAQNLHQRNQLARDQLTASGVKLIEVNHASLISQIFPTFRRNHVKLFIIDQKYGWVGGVNLLDRAFECQDFMVRYDTPAEVEILASQFERINGQRWATNQEIMLNSTDLFLIDAGKIGNSIIYDRALDLIDSAQVKIDFISQFVPEGKIRQALLQASARGVVVNIITTHESAKTRWSPAHRAAYQVFQQDLKKYRLITFRHSAQRVHAKLLLVDDTQALFGSHNLVDTGVLMGTEEIAVHTTNLDLIKQLLQFNGDLK